MSASEKKSVRIRNESEVRGGLATRPCVGTAPRLKLEKPARHIGEFRESSETRSPGPAKRAVGTRNSQSEPTRGEDPIRPLAGHQCQRHDSSGRKSGKKTAGEPWKRAGGPLGLKLAQRPALCRFPARLRFHLSPSSNPTKTMTSAARWSPLVLQFDQGIRPAHVSGQLFNPQKLRQGRSMETAKSA